MTFSENTLRNIIREYLDDYNNNDRFNYSFANGQILISESKDNSGVDKNAVMALLNEYFTDYSIKDKFIYDSSCCNLLIAVVTIKATPTLDNKQKSLNYCVEMKKLCEHADSANNAEIGFITCNGEYCEGIESKSKNIFNSGFGENEVIG